MEEDHARAPPAVGASIGVGHEHSGDLLAAHTATPGRCSQCCKLPQRAHRSLSWRPMASSAAFIGVPSSASSSRQRRSRSISIRAFAAASSVPLRVGRERRAASRRASARAAAAAAGVRRLRALVEDEQQQPDDPKHGQPGERGVVVAADVDADFLGLLNARVEILARASDRREIERTAALRAAAIFGGEVVFEIKGARRD